MEKDQSRLKVICEIRKERINSYPYYIVATVHSAQDHHFIVVADYRGETAELTIYPFKNDMTRLTASVVSLNDILPRKLIATLHVTNIAFRPNSNSVTILQAEFIVGYRTGHLVVVECKDRECKVKQRFNRGLKGQGFFSRASSAIFGGEDTYTPYFKLPIRSFTINPFTPDFYHIWQVGNNIILQRELNEEKESKFLFRLETMDLDNFRINYDIGKIVKDGDFSMFGCEYYTYFGHPQNKIFFITFKQEINSFANIFSRKELAVSLTSKEQLLLLDHNNFILKSVIRLQIPLRNITSFAHQGKDYLVLMPYENHIILYNLANNRYCKMRGHRSYVANVHYNSKDKRIITAGMDHCISFIKMNDISAESWVEGEKGPSSSVIVREFGVAEQKFTSIFRIGQYNPTRSNQSSYGYGSLMELNGHLCFGTYDSRIIIYAPF